MDPEFRSFIGDDALSIDLINIGPLDDLHQPKGIIKQAQDLAAEAFGADHTFSLFKERAEQLWQWLWRHVDLEIKLSFLETCINLL